jgi:hypothetical protein
MKVSESVVKGRCLLAQRRFKKGDVIFAESPLVYIPRYIKDVEPIVPSSLLNSCVVDGHIESKYPLLGYRLAVDSLKSENIIQVLKLSFASFICVDGRFIVLVPNSNSKAQYATSV